MPRDSPLSFKKSFTICKSFSLVRDENDPLITGRVSWETQGSEKVTDNALFRNRQRIFR